MITLLSDVFIGIGIILVLFLAMYRWTSLTAKEGSMVTAIAILILYVPYALWRWPGADVMTMHLALYLVTAYILGIMGSAWEERKKEGTEQRHWFQWGPAVIVLFFVVVVSVDSVFLIIAQNGLGSKVTRLILPKPKNADFAGVHSFFPGTVVHSYQHDEDKYNAYQLQGVRQRQRGWTVSNGWVHAPVVGRPAQFRIEVKDKRGVPIEGADVKGVFMRMADSRKDQAFAMKEKGDGVYQVDIALPEPGLWELNLEVRLGKEIEELRGKTRVDVPTKS